MDYDYVTRPEPSTILIPDNRLGCGFSGIQDYAWRLHVKLAWGFKFSNLLAGLDIYEFTADSRYD